MAPWLSMPRSGASPWVSMTSHVKLTNANISSLFAGALRVPATGRISLDVDAEGQGLSAASLIGALKGSGAVAIEQAEIGGLDPAAIDAVILALERDRSLSANPGRMTDIANARLDAGRLRMPLAVTALTIADGGRNLHGLPLPPKTPRSPDR